MNTKRLPIVIAVVAVIVLVCICGGVAVAYSAWNMPLGPVLGTGTEIFASTPAVIANLVPAETPLTTAAATPRPLATSNHEGAAPASNCGKTGSQNILVMGVDAPSGLGLHGPLAIRIVKIDFSNKSATSFSFPRDLWLPISGLEAFGFTQARLGESYLIAKSNAGMSTGSATNILAQALNLNFGAVSDHYITAKLSTLGSIIDTVGGITVNIPVAYDGTPYHLHYFPAGPYFMTGSLALEFATAPSSPAQWSGVDRQTQVLIALFQKIYSSEVIPRIPSLIPQFLQAVTTDLSPQQIMDLICIAQQISADKIRVSGVGATDVTLGSSGVLYPNVEIIRSKVEQFIGKS
jgi:polyisoprenyl-teichoic acid--peptidoglycan teichoic acid transferase